MKAKILSVSDSPSDAAVVDETVGTATETSRKRWLLRGLIILLIVVVALTGGAVAAWQNGGFEMVRWNPVDVEAGQAIEVNGMELTFTTASYLRRDSGSVRVYIYGTCRNTTQIGVEFLSWFERAGFVLGPGVNGGADVAADSISLSMDLSPYGAATFNPSDTPLPCRVLATFQNGMGTGEYVTVAIGEVETLPVLFEPISIDNWAPTTYNKYRIKVPLTEE